MVRILVADDDAAMRAMLAAALKRKGFEVDEANDGAEALEQLRGALAEGNPPAIIVSDVQMPGLTGLDVLHWVKRSMSEIPVILITAFGDARTHRRAAQLGAAHVLDKPFDMSALERKIHGALSSRESSPPSSA